MVITTILSRHELAVGHVSLNDSSVTCSDVSFVPEVQDRYWSTK